jgi:hypothetical protein
VPAAATSNVDYFFIAEISGCSIDEGRVTALPAARPGALPNPISWETPQTLRAAFK